jgi:hypothetical protein
MLSDITPSRDNVLVPYVFSTGDKVTLGFMSLIAACAGYCWGLGLQLIFTNHPLAVIAVFVGLAFGALVPYATVRRYQTTVSFSKWTRLLGPVLFLLATIPLAYAGIDYLYNHGVFSLRTALFVSILILIEESFRNLFDYDFEKLRVFFEARK